MEENVPVIDAADALRLAIDGEKSSLKGQRAELCGASRDVIRSYKKYSRAKNKAAQRKSTRNLMRLEKSQTELGMYIDGYAMAKEKMQSALDGVIKAYERYLDALCLAEDFSSAKKATRCMDFYVKRIERFIAKKDDSVACIASFYTLSIREPVGEQNAECAQKTEYGVQNSAPNSSLVHTNEVEISPVSIDIGPTVERAVERAIAEFSDVLEKRISELAVTALNNSQALCEVADKIATANAALTDLLAELDKIISDVGVLNEICQTTDIQQDSTAELQIPEVEVVPVNQEQQAIDVQECAPEQCEVLTETENTETGEDTENG